MLNQQEIDHMIRMIEADNNACVSHIKQISNDKTYTEDNKDILVGYFRDRQKKNGIIMEKLETLSV